MKQTCRPLSRGTLKNKLLCVYFLLLVLPLGIFTLYASFRIRSVSGAQTLTTAQSAFDSAYGSVQQSLDKLDEVLDILTANPVVYAMASNDPADYSYIKRLEDSEQLAQTFQHLKKLSGVAEIRLYVDNDYLYAAGQNRITQVQEVRGEPWYSAAAGSSGRSWFAPADLSARRFSAMQVIYNPRSVFEPLAILRVDASEDYLLHYLNAEPVVEGGTLLLLRGSDVLCASDRGLSPQQQAQIASLLPENGSDWETLYLQKEKFFIQCRGLEGMSWRIACVLPAAGVFHLSQELRMEMLFVVVLLGVAAYLLAYTISQSTLKRVSLLTGTMQAVEKGNVSVRLKPSGSDEIAQMMTGFNQMMDRVDTLMEERVEYGRQIKNLELKALQAQINPHFLYNSLDLINCTAISRNVPEISRMVNALGRFYRLSLSKGREVIPLSDEIQHAKLYVEIQNMRFENRVRVQWNLDPAAAQCQIIKIVLQPLIENAIIHGIFEKPSKCGNLTVTVRRESEAIRITVEDDGVGMDAATLMTNFSPAAPGQITATSGGYGVRNIQDRLRLAYGEPFGLSCVSHPGEGTTVTVFIPAIEPSDSPQEG